MEFSTSRERNKTYLRNNRKMGGGRNEKLYIYIKGKDLENKFSGK